MDFTLESIREHVGQASFGRGREYYVQGKVKNVESVDDTISGTVKGSTSTLYETEFIFKGDEIIDSSCSCPVGYACKHVAALGLQALMQAVRSPQKYTLPDMFP